MLIAKKIAFLRSQSLNFAIAIVLRSSDQMAIANCDVDCEKMIAIDDQNIADHSCLVQRSFGLLMKYNALSAIFCS